MTDELKVDDLTELWRAGAVFMPDAAHQYGMCAIALHHTALSDWVFQTSDEISPLARPWRLFRDTVQDRVIGASAERCADAGATLVHIADGYATTDYLNADKLKEYNDVKTNILSGSNLTYQVPAVPDPPHSGDPHPETTGENPHPEDTGL